MWTNEHTMQRVKIFDAPVILGQSKAGGKKQVLLHQLCVAAIVKANASKRQSKYQFHDVAILHVIDEVELVIADNSQIIQTTQLFQSIHT